MFWSLVVMMVNCSSGFFTQYFSWNPNIFILFRSMTSGEVVTSLTGHQAGCGISGLAASTIGLWSASFDCSVTSQIFSPALNVWQVRLWGRAEGGYTCLAVLSGHKHPIRCLAVDSARWFLIIIIDKTICCRLVSGDYRGFVMIWEMEEIKEELLSLERRVKSLPKDKWVHSLHLGTVYLSKSNLCDIPQSSQEREEERRNIFHKTWIQACPVARQDRCGWGDVWTCLWTESIEK